jgi:hypothetical protein
MSGLLRLNPWQTAALLGFALFAPASLPAGAGDRRQPEVRRRQAREPWLSTRPMALHCAPRCQAPVLRSLEPGVPLRVLRSWLAPNGRRWLQVEATTAAGPSRGWLLS